MRPCDVCAAALAATLFLCADATAGNPVRGQSTGQGVARPLSPIEHLQAALDPRRQLGTLIEDVVGRDLYDCGQLQMARGTPDADRINTEAMERALACGLERASKRTPFWTYIGENGIDSWLATGLMGTKDGTIIHFWWDSGPCGGPDCPGRLHQKPCERPRVGRTRSGVSFVCD